ncbi:unnamed protein product [Miscanthus lutarioriparius]|uniref:Uncharacterized protein n=1 Tax=Miscanthus lutarioriparius TaxID=422564 RepID=A0A811R8X0_9POAL|nr:unnamed protein product [Miscanthus lutarioriparius]
MPRAFHLGDPPPQFENIAERFTDKAAEKRPVVEGADQPRKTGSRLRTGGALNIGGDSGRKRSRPSGAGEEDDDDTIPLSQQFCMNLPGQEETTSVSPTRSRPQEAARPQQTGQQPPTQRSQQGPPPAARQERTTTGATPTSAGTAARPRSSSVAPGREPPRTTEAVSTPTVQGVPPPQRHEPTPPVLRLRDRGALVVVARQVGASASGSHNLRSSTEVPISFRPAPSSVAGTAEQQRETAAEQPRPIVEEARRSPPRALTPPRQEEAAAVADGDHAPQSSIPKRRAISQDLEKNSEYTRHCYNSIEPTLKENEALKAEVAKLKSQVSELKEQLLEVATKESALSSERPVMEETCARLEKEKIDLAVETTVLKLELECLRGKKEGAEAAAERLAAELEAVRAGNKRQFDEFARQVQWYQDKAQQMEEGVTPLLNIIEMDNTSSASNRGLPNPMVIVERCRNSLGNFKGFVEEARHYVASHVLGVVRSHYPTVDLNRFAAGVAAGTSEERAGELRDESREVAEAIVGDIHLY